MKFDGVRVDLDATSDEGVQDAVGVRYVKEGELKRRLSMQQFAAVNARRGAYHFFVPISGSFTMALGNDGIMRVEAI